MNSLQRVTQEIQQGMNNGELRVKQIHSERNGKAVKYVIDVLELDKEENKECIFCKGRCLYAKETNENIRELTAVVTEEDLHTPKIKFEITIDGVINVEDQIEVQKLYDSIVEFTTKYGGMSVTKCSGELSTMKAKEEGTLKAHTITPDATTFYEKNIGLIADEVYKRMSEDFQRGLRTRL